ncbi:N-acetylglucosaminyl-phosphatidylinositol de-N-acetylase [Chanos chanos]|uniref:N-acetylglucosaminylphosphatidylinositol deacetylase n=1 Tax=Chanos chanos TaxID=29144 RepID=A0A6J2WX88_CHACN|nr:N-acetylglucosaminyl-phosphatidylinositol de-N-acetylase [Chanos chanos]
MFTLLSVGLIFLFYLTLIKLVYYRYKVKWPTLWNKMLLRLRGEDINLYRTRERHESYSRKSVKVAHEPGDVRVLLVTAHPDDECMFFAPTIIRLVELNVSILVLCLSSGNYYNQGVQRQKELLDSCAVLGIPASQVTIIDDKELPDDPKVEWSVALTSSLILKHIRTHSINLVLTFDGRGVSGHANHIAIYKAVSHLAFAGRIPADCQVLALRTVSILRKYLSVLDLPISWLRPSDLCCVIGLEECRRAKRAMLCHRTQLLWFRYLYILFSSYMFVNTFQAIAVETKNLKIY